MKRRGLVLAAATMLAGCGLFGSKKEAPPPSAAAPADTTLELTLAGGPKLNPNINGRPSSAVVRVFDLKTTAAFDAATFEGLFERDREVLASEVVARDEFTLTPNESRKIERKLGPDTRALGIVVGFRELERATWRTTVLLKPNSKNRINVLLDGVTVIAAQIP